MPTIEERLAQAVADEQTADTQQRAGQWDAEVQSRRGAGHAYEVVAAEAMVRAHRAYGLAEEALGATAIERGQWDAGIDHFVQSARHFGNGKHVRGAEPGWGAEMTARQHMAHGRLAAVRGGRLLRLNGDKALQTWCFDEARYHYATAAAVDGAPPGVVANALSLSHESRAMSAATRGDKALSEGQHGAATDCFEEARLAFSSSIAVAGGCRKRSNLEAQQHLMRAASARSRADAAAQNGDLAGSAECSRERVRALEDALKIPGASLQIADHAQNKLREAREQAARYPDMKRGKGDAAYGASAPGSSDSPGNVYPAAVKIEPRGFDPATVKMEPRGVCPATVKMEPAPQGGRSVLAGQVKVEGSGDRKRAAAENGPPGKLSRADSRPRGANPVVQSPRATGPQL